MGWCRRISVENHWFSRIQECPKGASGVKRERGLLHMKKMVDKKRQLAARSAFRRPYLILAPS